MGLLRWRGIGLLCLACLLLAGCSGAVSFLQTKKQSEACYETVPGARDLAYGPDRHQVLDIYQPPAPGQKSPVLVFIHGGGWNFGDKAYESALLRPFWQRGLVVVTINYRLTPGARFPDQLEDCLLALAWVHDHIEAYGGDPGDIHLVGHSAGAHLAALAAVEPEVLAGRGLPPGCLHSCVALSGVYDLKDDFARRVQGFVHDFLPSAADAGPASPQRVLEVGPAPRTTRFLVAVGGRDEAHFAEQAERFSRVLAAKGASVRFLLLPGKNHGQVLQAMGDEHSGLFEAMTELFSAPARL
jgi:acetyl esterase/lipase